MSYQSFSDLPVNSADWERYLNIKVEYIVAHARVSAYDKLRREYVDIAMAQVYPVKIHTTGKYTIWESATGGAPTLQNHRGGRTPPRESPRPPPTCGGGSRRRRNGGGNG